MRKLTIEWNESGNLKIPFGVIDARRNKNIKCVFLVGAEDFSTQEIAGIIQVMGEYYEKRQIADIEFNERME